jgi:hypothetical protein
MDLSYAKEHIDTFVIVSGDSDFSPLVSKLKENNKYVIGIGVKNSTSDLLSENCDEFIFYEDLVRGQQPMKKIANVPEKLQECFSLLVDSVIALQRENKEILWGSMVKETMKRKRPSFNETYYGFRSFSNLLEEAQRKGIVVLRKDHRSGSYIVEDLGSVSVGPSPARSEPAASDSNGSDNDSSNGNRSPRRRRSRPRRPRGESQARASETSPAEDDAEDGADEKADVGRDENGAEAPARDRGRRGRDTGGEKPRPAPEEERSPGEEREKPRFSFFSWMRRDEPEE